MLSAEQAQALQILILQAYGFVTKRGFYVKFKILETLAHVVFQLRKAEEDISDLSLGRKERKIRKEGEIMKDIKGKQNQWKE